MKNSVKVKEGFAEQACSVVDNSFESVLWRRLACDFRVHAGWRLDDMERHFRDVLKRTLNEFPPNSPQSATKIDYDHQTNSIPAN